jgi:hypothetical protein
MAGTGLQEQTGKMKIFPVPATKEVSLSLENYNGGSAEITIINGLGTSVLRKRAAVTEGKSVTKLDVSTLASGIYFVKVQQGETSSMEKLVIQR